MVAALVTGILSLRSPKVYMATASIVPPIDMLQQQGGLANKLGGGGQSLLRGMLDTGSVSELYTGILKSRVVSDKIIDRFDLLKVYEGVRTWTDARSRLGGNTIIKVGREGIVQISVKDLDPNRAAAMANAYVEELDLQIKRLSAGQAASKRKFFEGRLAEVEEKLKKIDNILTRDVEIQQMIFEMLAREYELAKMEEAKSMPTIQVLDKAVPPENRLARGTARKGILAGIAALMLGIFLAFTWEYVKRMKTIETNGQQATATA